MALPNPARRDIDVELDSAAAVATAGRNLRHRAPSLRYSVERAVIIHHASHGVQDAGFGFHAEVLEPPR